VQEAVIARDRIAKSRIADTRLGTWFVPSRITAPWRRVRELGETIELKRGQTLYDQQDPADFFYLILKGYVKFYVLRHDGSTLLLEIVGEGGIFGEGAAFDRQPRLAGAAAVTDVQLVRFDPASIRELLTTEVDLSLSLLALMSAKQRTLAHKLAQTTSPSAIERIGELLLRLTESEHGDDSTVHLTHDQIAAMVGVSRITVTRLLGALAGKGAVATGQREVRLTDRGLLKRLLGLNF
jgi:CRP/FNR family transcriptional regulator, cyclic AMP receptor protein